MPSKSPQMVDSETLKLLFALGDARDRFVEHLVGGLAARGHQGASASALGFLGQLECGTNNASEIARQLGVTRQMVGKHVKAMVALGFLTLREESEQRNRKVIAFTPSGEALMADAREILSELDDELSDLLGPGGITTLTQALGAVDDHLANKSTQQS